VPVYDVAERNAFLDNQFGPNHGASAPSSHDVALFNGDPANGGTEISGNGYARVTVPNDSTWPVAADGQKTRPVTFPAPTAAWGEVTHWGLYNGTVLGFYDALDSPGEVTAASSQGPTVQVAIYFSDNAGA
jgi:hypothetical protein